jgi:hypothetical protein
METDAERLRVAIERKFQPPIDLLLDPSLLATERSLGRVRDSELFESQTQTTLGGAPTQSLVESVRIPGAIGKLLATNSPSEITETSVWEFFRGTARGSTPASIGQFLDQNDIESFNPEPAPEAQHWGRTVRESAGDGRLGDVLAEEYHFLESGGVILSRTPKSVELLRDAGTATVDIGNASLADSIEDQLERIGYPETASVCAFGVASVDSTVDALTGGVLSASPGMIVYKLGG